MSRVWTAEQKRFRLDWQRRRSAALLAAGKCSCGQPVEPQHVRCSTCIDKDRARRPPKPPKAAKEVAYPDKRRALVRALRDMAPPIIPVACSAVVIGGAVVVTR